jgi:hypothetical protein
MRYDPFADLGTSMRTWIFQGNPEVFDIEGYLAASAGLISWSVGRYDGHGGGVRRMPLPM